MISDKLYSLFAESFLQVTLNNKELSNEKKILLFYYCICF